MGDAAAAGRPSEVDGLDGRVCPVYGRLASDHANRSRELFGTGFFIGDGRTVATAHHVVEMVRTHFTGKPFVIEIGILAPPDPLAAARPTLVTHPVKLGPYRPAPLDIALLIGEFENQPPLALESWNDSGEALRSSGFPASHPHSKDGYALGLGPLSFLQGARRKGGGALRFLQLRLDETSPKDEAEADNLARLAAGYSGAPLFVPGRQCAVGMIVTDDPMGAITPIQGLTLRGVGFHDVLDYAPDIAAHMRISGRSAERPRARKRRQAGRDRANELAAELVTLTQRTLKERLGRSGGAVVKGRSAELHKLSQHGALDALAQLARSLDASRAVLVGQRGTGKSYVLRHFALRLAEARARAVGRSRRRAIAPIPLILDLGRLFLPKEDLARLQASGFPAQDFWDSILASWLATVANPARRELDARDGHAVQDVSVADLQAIIDRFPAIVILDGIDEFMLGHGNALETPAFRAMATHLRVRAEQNSVLRPKFVFAIRSGWLNYQRLAVEPESEIIQLGLLSEEQAKQFVDPETLARVRQLLTNPEDRGLTQTPLILRYLRDAAHQLFSGDRHSGTATRAINGASLIESCAQAILAQPGQAATDADLDALSLLAYVLEGLRTSQPDPSGPVPLSALFDGPMQRLRLQWTSLPEVDTGLAAPTRKTMHDALAILNDPHHRMRLLQTTLFRATQDRYEFDHARWREFFLGRYLARCIAARNFAPFLYRTYHSAIFGFAARFASTYGYALSENMLAVLADLRTQSPLAGEFALGNILLVFGFDLAPLEPAALVQLRESMPSIPPLARHVILGVLFARAMRADAGDAARDHLRATLREIATTLIPDQRVNILTRGLAWRGLKAIARNVPQHLGPWPAPSMSNFDEILQLACPAYATGPAGTVLLDTLQIGYARSIFDLSQEAPYRGLTIPDYLIMAVCMRRSIHAKPALSELLKAIFVSDPAATGDPNPPRAVLAPQIEERMGRFATRYGIPQITKLLALAADIYNDAGPGTVDALGPQSPA